MTDITGLLGPINDILSTTFGGLDKLFTSDDERNKAKILLIEAQGKIEEALSQGITARAEADMKSDSWLAKNIRPLTLLGVVLLYIGVTIASAFGATISKNIIDILQSWGVMIFSFYFGSRGIEKIASTISTAVTENTKAKKS